MLKFYQFFVGRHYAVSWAEIRSLKFFKKVSALTLATGKVEQVAPFLKEFDDFFKDFRLNDSVIVASKYSNKKIIDIFATMGGSTKVAEVIYSSADINRLINYIFKQKLQQQARLLVRFNFYNVPRRNIKYLITLLKEQKKEAKAVGSKVKFLGNLQESKVNTASTLRVIQKGGIEINISYDNKFHVYIASKTISVQNYDLFSRIEFDRPERDMQIGMMPIKLALIMLNLAGLKQEDGFWDPMCGVGTLVMAGLLKNLYSYGSDINHVAVAKARHNIDWLLKAGLVKEPRFRVFKFDVTKDPRNNKILRDIIRFGRFDAVVTEGYLGEPRKKPYVNKVYVAKQLRIIEKLYKSFLRNISRTVYPGKRVVFTIPIFKVKSFAKPIYDKKQRKLLYEWIAPNISINRNRYKVIKFNTGDLEWVNKNSIVARKIFVLEKIK